MKHDETNFDSNPISTPSLDPELEARVVAWVLGEASPIETAELERLAAERPEVAEFKRSMETVHGLIGAAERPAAAGGGVVWRMAPERRAALLAKLGEGEISGAAAGEGKATNVVTLPIQVRRGTAWRAWALPVAACLALAGLLAAIVVPTVGHTFGVAYKKPSRPDASAVVMLSPQGAYEALETRSPATPAPVAAPVWADEFKKGAKDAEGFSDSNVGSFDVGGAHRLEAVSGEVRRRGALRNNAGKNEALGLSVTVDTVQASDHVFRDVNGAGTLGAVSASDSVRFNEELVYGGAPSEPASRREADKLLLDGRSQYLAGDLDAAQVSFRGAQAVAPEGAEAEYSLGEISMEKAKIGTLTREKQRALVLEEVSKSWQRPGVFKENKADAAKPADAMDDAPAERPVVFIPPFDESLRAEVATEGAAVSTFSLHVGDASFRLAKAALERGAAPDAATIRPEEFYNAFDYGDPAPAAGEPVAGRVEQAAHPFLQQRNLVRIALRVPAAGRGAGTPLNLTVLLDTSGSMEREDRAATVRAALGSLAALLGANDRVTLVGFARQPRLLVEGLAGDQAAQLVELAARTPAEGGTNLEEALKLAGELARRQWRAGAQNRIVLLTDGAANLGDADPARLSAQVEALRRQGVAFDACGVGADGLDDGVLEALTRKGDGRYQVLNSPEEADAGFARKLAGAFRPAAENVKVQVRFNPARVARYRLVGFEKHRLREEDFRNDQVDAAELAAEEAAVALYQVEVIPGAELGELGDVAVRFRDPARGEMVERNWSLAYEAQPAAFDRASASLRLAGASALLAEKLRGGALAGQIRLDELAPVVAGLRGAYAGDARVEEFLRMFDQARRLAGE